MLLDICVALYWRKVQGVLFSSMDNLHLESIITHVEVELIQEINLQGSLDPQHFHPIFTVK